MSIAEGMAAAKACGDLVKFLLDLTRRPSPNQEEIRNRLIEIQDLVISAKSALSEAEDEIHAGAKLIRTLERQVEELKALNNLREDFEHIPDGGFLIKKSDHEKGHLIPYCPVCWGANQKAVPLVEGATGYYTCALCESPYKTAAHREAMRKRRERI